MLLCKKKLFENECFILMFRLPGTVVMSEPWTLTSLNELRNLGNFKSDVEAGRIVRSIMRVQCKPLRQKKCERYENCPVIS